MQYYVLFHKPYRIAVNYLYGNGKINFWEPLKTGVKSKNGQGVPASRKADEVRLYALRGGLTTKMVRTAHFRSHKVFRGDLCPVQIGKSQHARFLIVEGIVLEPIAII